MKKEQCCESDSSKKPVRMPKEQMRPVSDKSKCKTGNVSGPKYS